jgi:AcrR family transcriptional regulator
MATARMLAVHRGRGNLKKLGRRSESGSHDSRPRAARTAGEVATSPRRRKGRARPGASKTPRRSGAGRPVGRASLLGAAASLFAELGYDAVTTRQILERAGVEAPSLYHHFGSKLGLYRAVLAESSEPFVAAFARLAQRLRSSGPPDARSRLNELVWTMFQGQLRNPETFQIALFEVHRPGPRRYDLIAIWEQLRNVFKATLDEGIASGELEPRGASGEVAANLLLGGLTVYLQLHQMGRQRGLTRRLARQITDALVDGLLPRVERASRVSPVARGAA